jgi:hypothetical protein
MIGGREIIHSNIEYLKSLLDGAHFKIPYNLDPFYQETHLSNLHNVRKN